MYLCLSSLLFLGAPVAAAFLPILLRKTAAAELFHCFALGSGPRGLRSAELRPAELNPRADRLLRTIIPGAVLFITVLGVHCARGAWPGTSAAALGPLRDSLFIGLPLALVPFAFWLSVRQGWNACRCTRAFDRMGIVGTWVCPQDRDAPFRDALIAAVGARKTLDAVGSDGLSILELLTARGADTFAKPHPALVGAHIRLLLVPPRSDAVDPERGRLTCAEEALSRLGRSSEDHWRYLRQALDVCRVWSDNSDIELEVKFLQSRPAFRSLIVGTQVWMRPWDAPEGMWIEARDQLRGQRIAAAMHDHFLSAWAYARSDETVAQPVPGSVIMRKDGTLVVGQVESLAG